MFKAIKIFFIATTLILALETKPFAKEKDGVHNKAPGVELTKNDVVITAQIIDIAPVIINSLDISPGLVYVELTPMENFVTIKKLVGLKPPLSQRSRYFDRYVLTKYNFKLVPTKWKDTHRKHLSFS